MTMEQMAAHDMTEAPASAPPEKHERKKDVSARIRDGGLLAAPFLIMALAAGLYFYYQSLDLANAKRQQRSALAWSENLVPQIQDTLILAFFSTVIVIAVAVPLGIMLTRESLRRVAPGIVGFANAGQAIPAYGLIVLALIIGGQGKVSVVFALAFYALLPVLRNTMVGLDAVDRSVIEAGRGMGMTRRLVLTRIELPLAVPIIVAGIRTAVIINIGMSTLAYLIGGGGLGITISSGIKLSQNPVLIVGAILVAIIALTFDWLGALAERFLRPHGL